MITRLRILSFFFLLYSYSLILSFSNVMKLFVILDETLVKKEERKRNFHFDFPSIISLIRYEITNIWTISIMKDLNLLSKFLSKYLVCAINNLSQRVKGVLEDVIIKILRNSSSFFFFWHYLQSCRYKHDEIF